MDTGWHHEAGRQGTATENGAEAPGRYVGIDVGAETIKIVELLRSEAGLTVGRLEVIEHGKKPGPVLLEALRGWDWAGVDGAAVSGRFSSRVNLPRIPTKQAQLAGYRFLFGQAPGTVVNIGSQGFSVLEAGTDGLTHFRENSRCSQGTGNFLRQLVERFSLTVEDAGILCAEEANPAPLSGRCPVILKTDMTHLANKGEDRARILAGLFDAVCENVLLLVKPGSSPPRVLLVGGVSRSPRVRRTFSQKLAERAMEFVQLGDLESVCLEAFGCAVAASRRPAPVSSLEHLLLPAPVLKLERLQGLGAALGHVKRLTARPMLAPGPQPGPVVVGFDVGSTGSKVLVLDAATEQVVWEDYRRTLGDPVGAAQDLLQRFIAGPAGKAPVVAFGATGSGREVTGSLLTSCFGKDSVFVVNEIVAHATGALYYDARVDTIFEIGGQDAKYIRLTEGRVVECAMNEACSAGTGSFIEEQGSKFAGIPDVRELGRMALGARSGVSLGQHCSVFMAEVIDEAVASGVEQGAILSGLYDSIIKNYLNRVKGNRSVGKVIFCQGMPFAADALAAAVARQTGCEVIVPPNPGTVGALGIALLANRELRPQYQPTLASTRFLEARVERKDTFVCRATTGCGGAGNRCRIERLRTVVGGERSLFTWGGGCALHDKATRKKKLPDRAPDPFRERGELLDAALQSHTAGRGRKRIAVSEEFMLQGLLPFFAAFFDRAGYDVVRVQGAGQATLKRGIQAASIPFCAPMQLFHGVKEDLGQTGADWLFVPMIRSVPGVAGQKHSVVCPIVQAGPDLVRSSGPAMARSQWLCPVINFGPGGFHSAEFQASCRGLAHLLGVAPVDGESALQAGLAAQGAFDATCLEIGRRALAFCSQRGIVPVVVLGRSYTIYNTTLNSNVPAILREQGAIGIPMDCYPVEADTPVFPGMYWGYGQTVLRAAHQLRRAPGLYSVYCSNYSCGPDSFNLHFAAHIMEGKPFVVIETDGHCGDAGTKTRVEAFLHCVDEDRKAGRTDAGLNDFTTVKPDRLDLGKLRRRGGAGERVIVPYMGPASEVVALALRGVGLPIEQLPMPGPDALRLGRRYTSGKECLPLPLTLGSLLLRLEGARSEERFIYLMPGANGPCRLGVYHLLSRIVLDRLGWRGRVRIWSPKDDDYFAGLSGGMEIIVFAGVTASDLLAQARLDVRPHERAAGETNAWYQRWQRELLALVETAARDHGNLGPALWHATSGRLFGLVKLLDRAGAELAALRGPGRRPVVELTGEIYLRAVDFSNDFIVEKLEARGLQVRLAPMSEWLAYCSHLNRQARGPGSVASRLNHFVQHRIEGALFGALGRHLGWPHPPETADVLEVASRYVNPALEGEAVLTVGASLHAWRRSRIDAVINIGPLECMPSKIAEAQFHPAATREKLLSLSLAFDGNPINTTALDNFAYEIHARWQHRGAGKPAKQATLHS